MIIGNDPPFPIDSPCPSQNPPYPSFSMYAFWSSLEKTFVQSRSFISFGKVQNSNIWSLFLSKYFEQYLFLFSFQSWIISLWDLRYKLQWNAVKEKTLSEIVIHLLLSSYINLMISLKPFSFTKFHWNPYPESH